MVADTRFKYHPAAARRGRHRAASRCSARCCVPVRAGRGRQRLPRRPAARASPASATRARKLARAGRARRARRAAGAGERPAARAARAAPGAARCRAAAAEVLYEAADPYSRKVFIDRGSTHGVAARLAGDQRGRRARPGDARLPAVVRGHAADRQGRRDSRCSTRAPQQRSAAFGDRRTAADGAALHGRQRRRAGRRPADHQRRRRRLPAGPAGGQGDQRRPQGRFGLRAHRAARRSRGPTACATCWCSSRWACRCRPRPAAATRRGKPSSSARRRQAGEEHAHDHAARLRPAAAAGQPAVHLVARCCSRFVLNLVPLGRAAGDARLAGAGAGVLERAPAAPRRRRRRLRVRPADGRAPAAPCSASTRWPTRC